MRNRKLVIVLIVILVFATSNVISKCAKHLDEPVFVKNLVCSSDMDAEFSFITNKDDNREVIGIEIPNMPEHMRIQLYEEVVQTFNKYNRSTVYFGVASDDLSEDGSLKEDFVFHKVIVKWDDDTMTTADIGTIHMTPDQQSFVLGRNGGGGSTSDGKVIEQEIEYTAKEDMKITGVSLPYIDQLSDTITDLSLNQFAATTITEKTPVELKAGEEFTITCIIDYEASKKYGNIFLEGIITGENKDGDSFTDVFHVLDATDRNNDWINQQVNDKLKTR